eukprot:Em0001g1077a
MPLTPELQARLQKRGIVVKGDQQASATAAEKPKESEAKQILILPPFWKKVTDEKSNYPYYWNTKTNQVSWTPPTDSIYVHPNAGKAAAANAKKAADSSMKEKRRSNPYTKSARPRRYKPKDDALDPMDPAAYSDVPRGTWSSGLEVQGDAKTGVDTTASGPLYQMRPYPNPGDILRANRKPTEADDENDN